MRFSGFDDEWKTYKLKDLLHNKSSSISINQLDDNVGNYPLYGASGFLKCIDFYEMDSDYISIVKDGSGVGNISFHETNTSVVNTSQYILPKENLNIHFIFYLLQTINLNKYKTGSTIPHIYFKDYSIEKVKIPKYDEQKKIGILLKNLDAKIEILDNKLQMCQNFKKYLMQQIFTQKLRFDFDDEWEFKKLGDISVVKDGTHDSPKHVDNGYPLITSKNLIGNGLDFENVNYISNEDYDIINKRSNVDKGDILFGMIGTIGNPVIVETDDFAIKNVALIKEKTELLNNFLIYVLNTDLIRKQFYRLNAGGTQKFIALGLIKELSVPVPSIKEQKEISEFLSLVDNNLDNYRKQLHEINTFKKGLLQQMFVVQLILSLLQNKKHI